ncbi:MAG TPA: hypothetical protein VK880_05135 [Anaerolineales bacterium]|nr:hypothetical protein [Anaerolineales bacterium]
MVNEATKTVRPSSITLISVFLTIEGLLSFYFLFAGMHGPGLWETLFVALIGVVLLACGVGFWLMKKWAFYAYAVFGIIDQIVLLLMGRWNIIALLIPVVVIYVAYKHLSRMS